MMPSTTAGNVLMTCVLWMSMVLGSQSPRSPYAVKESHFVPHQWKRMGPAPAEHMVRLQIGLRQGQFDELERHLYQVSDPSHSRYGQHLSAADINDLVKPSDETLQKVHDWLHDNDIPLDKLEYSPSKDWIKVYLTIEAVERLLDTEYSLFKHEDDSYLIRTTRWSLPLDLHEHVETIQPTNSFFQPKPRRRALKKVPLDGAGQYPIGPSDVPSKATVAQACNVTAVTPICLRTLYGTTDYTVQSSGRNQIALTNYLGEANNRSDVNIFLKQFRPEAAAAAFNFTVQVIADGDDQQSPNNSTQLTAGKDLEGNLDAETILGITFPTPLTAYNTGGMPPFVPDALTPTDTNEPYLTWLQYILAQESIPPVISTSYGDDEQSVPLSLATSVCRGFAQLGARGVSVIFASGDNGVGPSGKCITNDGKNTSAFLPAFPAGCPYVTTVGATKNVSPEVAAFDAANGFASGGGFSNYFPRPEYQDSVVSAYITSLGGKFSGLFNTSGRGYPDIAAQGFHYVTIWNGTVVPLDGTSAATPTAASIIALVNDALLAAGKPVLGFLNPWLYSEGFKAFTDITDGSAIGCNTTGFPALPGWDAVTGWGTPYFPKFQAAAMNNGICSPAPIRLHTITFVFLATVIIIGC